MKAQKMPRIWLLITLLALVTIAIYARTSGFDFVHIDDKKLITENRLVNDKTIPYTECFRTLFKNAHYKPLVFLSWKAEYQFLGPSPGHFHIINWLLNLINTILVFYIGIQLFNHIFTGRKYEIMLAAFLLALLFAVTPLHIESVAWATERKDMLFSLFFLSSWLVYIRYVRKPNFLLIIAGSLLYLCSGLSKSMGITLPAVLLLTDFWFQRRISFKLIIEKIPYFAVLLALAWMYGLLQFDAAAITPESSANEAEAIGSQISNIEMIEKLPHLLQLILSASVRFVLWIAHILFPVKISVIYSHNIIFQHLGFSVYLFPILIAAMFFIAWKKRKTVPALITGLLFFTITLSPALALGSSGQAIFLSDRYTYIPSIGIFLIMVYYLISIKNNTLKYAVSGLLFIIYFSISLKAVNYWKNTETLFTQSLKINHTSGVSYLNLGKYYNETGATQKAIAVYTEGIKNHPGYYMLYSNLGKVYFDQGKVDNAITLFDKCLSLKSDYVSALANRGAAYGMKNDFERALEDLNKALQLAPNNLNSLSNRGLIYFYTKNYDKTITDYLHYLKIVPNDANIIGMLGLSYRHVGENDKSIDYLSRAIALMPNAPANYINRSYTYNVMGDKTKALNDALQAQKMGMKVNQNYINSLKK